MTGLNGNGEDMNSFGLLRKDIKNYYERSKCRNLFNFLCILLQTPSLWAVISFRIGSMLMDLYVIRTLYVFLIWNPVRMITGIEIYPRTVIGENLYIKHFGGIFIHPRSKIGNNCLIFNDVTIGSNFEETAFPVIGDNVTIGVGAKIIGGIHVGNNAIVGANAVVVKDVPDGAVVFGNPASFKLNEGKN